MLILINTLVKFIDLGLFIDDWMVRSLQALLVALNLLSLFLKLSLLFIEF